MNNHHVTTQRKHGGSIVLYQAIMFRGKSEWNMLYVIHTWIRNSKNVYDVNLDVFSMLGLLTVQGSSRVSGLFIYIWRVW